MSVNAEGFPPLSHTKNYLKPTNSYNNEAMRQTSLAWSLAWSWSCRRAGLEPKCGHAELRSLGNNFGCMGRWVARAVCYCLWGPPVPPVVCKVFLACPGGDSVLCPVAFLCLGPCWRTVHFFAALWKRHFHRLLTTLFAQRGWGGHARSR